MRWCIPSPAYIPHIPEKGSGSEFGAVRKYDIHTGVDLDHPEGTTVVAMEDGTVVAVELFTGPDAGSPWWLPTHAILVEGASGVIAYGEVEPMARIVGRGEWVAEGSLIGRIKRVIRHDKGTPTSMLHLELYERGTRETVWWRLGEEKPHNLLDPTPLLRGCL